MDVDDALLVGALIALVCLLVFALQQLRRDGFRISLLWVAIAVVLLFSILLTTEEAL